MKNKNNNSNNNNNNMRGMTADGYIRIQRTVLRRVICDRLQALLRGDFYVRNSLGGEEYDSMIREVEGKMQILMLDNNNIMEKMNNVIPQDSTTTTHLKQNTKNGNENQPTTNNYHDAAMTTTTSSSSFSYSTNLETFFQLLAASIMIDASMRGENSGESDTRFIKKKKKLLVKTLMGPKIYDFCKEVLRFDTLRRGGDVSDTELMDSEEEESSKEDSSDTDTDDDDKGSSGNRSRISANGSGGKNRNPKGKEEEEEEKVRIRNKERGGSGRFPKVPKGDSTATIDTLQNPQLLTKATMTTAITTTTSSSSSGTKDALKKKTIQEEVSSSTDDNDNNNDDDDDDDENDDNNIALSASDTDDLSSPSSNAEESSTLDGLSSSATSSKKRLDKKEKKRLRQLRRERKRIRKEERRQRRMRKRREKEMKKRRRTEEKERKKLIGGEISSSSIIISKDLKKKKKRKRKLHDEQEEEEENPDVLPSRNNKNKHHHHHHHLYHGEDHEDTTNMNKEYITSLKEEQRRLYQDDDSIDENDNDGDDDDEEGSSNDDENTPATKEEFELYKSDILKRVPKNVKSRFRQGGFSRWGKDWLPILELGPFDVEPGPVRDMWFDMFANTQANGRDMTRLVLWYGVKFEDRGQAYSFLPETKIIHYEEGQRNGYCQISSKIQQKINKNQKLTKTEEQIRRGLIEIEADMARDKSERAAWMMQFKEEYEYAEEEAAKKKNKKKMKKSKSKLNSEETLSVSETFLAKNKPGRPKKEEVIEKVKRKPGRPKKIMIDESSVEQSVDVEVKKRGPGRPKKSDKEKAEKKESKPKKWEIVDGDEESEIETDNDESDKDYNGRIDSSDDSDMDVDSGVDNSDARENFVSIKKRKVSSVDNQAKKKAKVYMTEEERIIDRRAKAAEYREKIARKRAEEQGLEYIKGKKGRKSKAAVLEEEQRKFAKCEEVFLPIMEHLSEAKDNSNVKDVLMCIQSVMERVEILTPSFLREYPLGMLVKSVRKSFEGGYPEVKDRCKGLTAEMKRVYTEKESKVPEDFEPVKKRTSLLESKQEAPGDHSTSCPSNSTQISIKSGTPILKTENISTDSLVIKSDPMNISSEPLLSKHNSELSLSESHSKKMVVIGSVECLDEVAKSEPSQLKQKRTFSIKGMFDKPKPLASATEKNKSSSLQTISSSASIVTQSVAPKQKLLPPWVVGPPVKIEGDLCGERVFGLEFLLDAASSAATFTKIIDPVSVSQSLELAIFAETKRLGNVWDHYWEKVHDVVSILSPGGDRQNSLLQGIISGDYQDPSDIVKLSRRDILTRQTTVSS